jgi:hypothetical protein
MFNIGDKLFLASCDNQDKHILCPDCLGKKRLTVIMGDGEYVSIPCANCGTGYNEPSGYVRIYEYMPKVREVIITGVQIAQGQPTEYRSDCYSLQEENLFKTKEEAEIKAKELADKHSKEELDRFNRKEKDTRSWAFNVSYHRQCIKRAEKDLEYHRGKLLIASSKVRAEKK